VPQVRRPGASSARADLGLLTSELLALEFLGSLVPVADLGLESFPNCASNLVDPLRRDGRHLLEVRTSEVFDGPALGSVLCRPVSPGQIEGVVDLGALVFGDGLVADVRLAARVDDGPVVVDLDVLEASANDLAAAFDVASVGDRVVEVDEQAGFGGWVVRSDEHGTAGQGFSVVGEYLLDDSREQRRTR
jgi:hypothetical protein